MTAREIVRYIFVMAAKVINNAENHLIVGSLEVIGDVTGSGMKTIRRSISAVTESVQNYITKQEDYWTEISADENITPLEKKVLKKEWNSIQQTYTAIMSQATEKNLQNKQAFIDYKTAYDALYNYLYVTIKIFDNMEATTKIDSRDVFNNFYSEYYSKENYTQLALAVGTISGNGYRVLSNLDEVGTENELGIYNAEIYQWKTNRWVKVGSNGYVGVQRSLPNEITGNYFLAGSDFYATLELLGPEGKVYTAPEGSSYTLQWLFEKAKIYEYTGSRWLEQPESDYKYLVVMTDYYELTGEFPPSWKDFLAEQMDDALQDMSEEMKADLQKLREELQGQIDNIHVTSYLGSFDTDPEGASNGDWYCYSGVETTTRIPGYMYIYTESTNTWTKLNPEDVGNSKYYMEGLSDVLKASDTTDVGHFNIIFANAFFANTGVLNRLGVHQIVLDEDGSIESKGYVAGGTDPGFCLDGGNGMLYCIGGEFSGKITTGDGSKIAGTCIVDKLHFNRKYTSSQITAFEDGDIWMM